MARIRFALNTTRSLSSFEGSRTTGLGLSAFHDATQTSPQVESAQRGARDLLVPFPAEQFVVSEQRSGRS
jgi:hypothetical protein